MKKLVFAIIAVFLYLTYGMFLSQYDLRIIPKELTEDHPVGFHDYKGVMNIHSTLSTGSGDMEEIIRAAQQADLDFISFTDLNIFKKPKQFEGYHNNLLVFVDGEYSYLNSRLLNYFATTDRHLQGVGRSQVLFADILSQKEKDPALGLFILAHPFKPRYQWTGDYPIGLDGIEVINLKSVWQNAWLHDKVSFFWSLLIYPFNDRLALLRLFQNPSRELALWDRLSQRRHTVGIAGADADAKMWAGHGNYLKFPSYKTLFSLVRNHVLLRSELTGNAESDRQKIAHAISAGQFYMSLDILADPKGFNAYVKTGKGKIYPMGSEIKMQDGLSLDIELPRKPNVPFDIFVIKNGSKMMTSNAKNTEFYIHSPGVYRVMVRVIPTFPLPDGKKWTPWIYTNPFYVR